jgi:zinc transporter ZupT
MGLLSQTMIISVSMIILCLLPLFSKSVRRHSSLFYLLGTGALFGICFFDLLPDVFEIGGNHGLAVMGLVWLVYSAAHLFHLGHHHHHHDSEPGADPRETRSHGKGSILPLLGSMMAHCFASGMLLVVSSDLPKRIAWTVFLALVAHKAYESLTVSTVLLQRHEKPREALLAIGAYAFSLPVGVLVTLLFRSVITQNVAILITSVAVGTLLGCLVFDFLVPSVRLMRQKASNGGWIMAGLLMSQLLLRIF